MDQDTEFSVQQILPKARTKEEFYLAPNVGLSEHLQEAWKQQLLFDYTIRVGDQEFKVHKVVMACVSDYFRAMLTGGMVESQADSVKLEGLDSLAVSNIIEYIYTNRILGERASPEGFLACAMYLQVPAAIKAAANLLLNKLDVQNCFDILTTFDSLSLVEAVDQTKKYMTTNMEEIVKVHGPGTLACEHLTVLIELWMDGEWDLFLTLKDWLDADYENRKQQLDSLMSHVRFSLFTPEQLEAVKKMKMYSDGSWRNNVQLGEDYHSQPFHKKMIIPSSVRSKPQVVAIQDQHASSIFALEEDGKWTEIDVPDLKETYKVSTAIEFNNFLVIIMVDDDFITPEDDDFTTPEDACDPEWHVFDVSTYKWSQIAGMKRPVSNFALVHDDRYIYALGGNAKLRGCEPEDKALDTIERYDPGSNTWTVMRTKLPGPLCRHSACVCSGPFFSIYVTGGYERLSYHSYSSEMSCFNPNEESATWHKKAPMLIASESHLMREMAFGGKDPAIIIMCANLVIQYYDLKTNQWSLSKALAHPDVHWGWHKNGTVLADPTENTLYILNICEHFPGTKKDPKEGACAKWPLGKLNDIIAGCPVEKFPILTGCWGHCLCAAVNYATAILAIPATSKRMSNSPFGRKESTRQNAPVNGTGNV